jgi:hypothetical protein
MPPDDGVHAAYAFAGRLRGVVARHASSTPEARVAAVREMFVGVDPGVARHLTTRHASTIGNLEGVPYELRYAANLQRIRDAAASARGPQRKRLKSFAAPIGTRRTVDPATGRPRTVDVHRQFLTFDPARAGRMVEVRGDLGRAKQVAVVVPGMLNGIRTFGKVVGETDRVRDAAGARDTAAVAWLGYHSPQHVDAIGTGRARAGAAGLREFRAGLDQQIAPGARVSVVAHSYGTVVTAGALRQGTRFDNAVLLGSPGLAPDVRGAADLGTAPGTRLFTARAPGDYVSYTQWHGRDPASFPDAVRMATAGGTSVTGHLGYLRPDTESLRNVGRVVGGRAGAVTTTATSPAREMLAAKRLLPTSVVSRGIGAVVERARALDTRQGVVPPPRAPGSTTPPPRQPPAPPARGPRGPQA